MTTTLPTDGEERSTPPARAAGKTTEKAASGGGLRGLRRRFAAWLDRPMTSLHLLLGVFVLLLGVGLMMVLSSSSVAAYRASEKAGSASSFGVFKDQLFFAGVGLVAFALFLKLPAEWLKKLSFAGVAASAFLLTLTLFIGRRLNGSTSWLQLGPVTFQPSELAKFALVVWGSYVLASRKAVLGSWKKLLIPVVFPVSAVLAGLILMQPDLGTTASLVVIVLALLFFAGASWWLFVFIGAGGVGGLLLYAVNNPVRMQRIQTFLNPGSDPQGTGMQLMQSLYSLSDGGIFGVGLGQSRAKWNYLPNADSDFIFAIIGEELGLIGAVSVILLYLTLLYTGLRIARRNVDPFVKLLASTATVWVVGQAMINIFYVIGLLPVTGLTLPMISTGGTSLIITMALFGILANFARREPQAVAAMGTRSPGRLSRFFGIGAPGVSLRPARAAARVTKKKNREWARTAARTARAEQTAQKEAARERARETRRRPAVATRAGSAERPRTGESRRTATSRTGTSRTGNSRSGTARAGTDRTTAPRAGSSRTARTGSSGAGPARTGGAEPADRRPGLARPRPDAGAVRGERTAQARPGREERSSTRRVRGTGTSRTGQTGRPTTSSNGDPRSMRTRSARPTRPSGEDRREAR